MSFSTVQSADVYFSTNFMSKDAWAVIPADDKKIVLETAESDILACLCAGVVSPCAFAEEPPFTVLQKAIFEWAVYLYENKDKIAQAVESKSYGISTVQVEGLGRETRGNLGKRYMDTYNDIIARSPAARFLNALGRTVNLVG